MQYKDTIDSSTALETTAETLARCIHLLDGDDKAFYAKLFVIIFDFAYDDLDQQDQTARKQTLENCEPLYCKNFSTLFLTVLPSYGSANTFRTISSTNGNFLQKAWNNVSKNMGGWKSLCEISTFVFSQVAEEIQNRAI
jgi:hypothetical protein